MVNRMMCNIITSIESHKCDAAGPSPSIMELIEVYIRNRYLGVEAMKDKIITNVETGVSRSLYDIYQEIVKPVIV